MIVLDTNVVSQILRGESPIDDWLAAQPAADVALTTITIAEVTYGIARLADGRRRTLLAETWGHTETTWGGQLLWLGPHEARAAGVARAARASMGRPMADSDAYIAGICLTHQAVLATRNTRDFEDVGLTLVNPWED